jgi:hypothetical protein
MPKQKWNKWKGHIKGRLFELVIKSILQKAGYETDIVKIDKEFKELKLFTKNLKTMRGRGGTYNYDLIGLFKLPIPFSYPILLVGEAKAYDRTIQLDVAREFIGIYTDVTQFINIDTFRHVTKYSQIFKKRPSYLPVVFSLKSIRKSAQALLYTHGINFISYEDHPLFRVVMNKIENLLKKINYKEIKNEDRLLTRLTTLQSFDSLPSKYKKIKYDEALNDLIKYTDALHSYLGVLDGQWVVNILTKSKLKRDFSKKIFKDNKSYYNVRENIVTIHNTENPRSFKIGYFSLPSYFITEFKKHKNQFESLCFYIIRNDKLYPYYIKLVGEQF